ncbi:MAG: archaemetzincin [bacterium]
MGVLKSKIVVVPLGEVDFGLVNRLANQVGPIFNRSVDIIKGMKMPKEAHNIIRNQYYALVIMAKLERIKSNSREKVIAICEESIYLPDESYIIGYADAVSGTGVVSLNQLRVEFYGLPENESWIYPRLLKETVHRLGHIFGLSECRNSKCVNYYSQMMLDIDHKGDKFCDICSRKLTGLV